MKLVQDGGTMNIFCDYYPCPNAQGDIFAAEDNPEPYKTLEEAEVAAIERGWGFVHCGTFAEDDKLICQETLPIGPRLVPLKTNHYIN